MVNSAEGGLSVLIVGGGLGGLATTLAVLKFSPHHRVTVLEASPKISEIGAGLTVMPNGMRVLRQLEVYPDDPILGGWTKGGTTDMDLTGKEHVFESGSATSETVEKYGGWMHVHRGDLQATLLAHVRTYGERVVIRTDARVVGLDCATTSLTLESGEALTADVIVGADGIKSVCRPAIVGRATEPISVAYAYRYQIPRDLVYDRNLQHLLIQHSMWSCGPFRIVAYPVRHQSLLNCVALCPPSLFSTVNSKEESWTLPASPEEIKSNFARAPMTLCQVAADILDLAQFAPEVRSWRIADREVISQYSKGHCALLGDSAHAMSPALGQGVNQAFEDAVVLGFLLGSATNSTVESVLQRYSEIRSDRAGTVQLCSRIFIRKGLKEEELPVVEGKRVSAVEQLTPYLWGKDVLAEFQ